MHYLLIVELVNILSAGVFDVGIVKKLSGNIRNKVKIFFKAIL